MLARYTQKLWSYVKPFLSGLVWPFTWLESKSASAGLLVSIFLLMTAATVAGVLIIYAIPTGSSNSSSGTTDPNCNAVGIEIRGCIMTYKPDNTDGLTGSADSPCDAITSSEEVIWKLADAADNPNIKAVVLEIDSGGGSPVAAEEIAAAMKALGKPSVAWVRESADSAAYWIASAADTVIASAGSDVGSIGVTQSYVDNANKNIKDGLTYNQLTTGKYKDTGTPDRALTADERTLIQRDLNITLQNFIQAIATNRHLPVAKVAALADGSTMLGEMALQNGLIDQLGTKTEVWQKLEADIGEKPDVCWP
jgi:protease-4